MKQIKLNRTEQAVNEVMTGLIFTIKKAMPESSSKLRSSVDYRLKRRNENFIITIKYLKYGDYVETGTKPHTPPIDALKKWAKRKGLNPWAVQNAISKKGTKPQPWKQVIEPYIDKNMSKIRRAFEIDVKDYILENFKF